MVNLVLWMLYQKRKIREAENFSQLREGIREMVRPERFELPTFWFVARRSIQLS
jgi:hypothetical protein